MADRTITFAVERDRLSVRLTEDGRATAEEAVSDQLTESTLLEALDALLARQSLVLADIADIRVESSLPEHALSRRMAETAVRMLRFAGKSGIS